jgi:hypothetical protein
MGWEFGYLWSHKIGFLSPNPASGPAEWYPQW